MKARAVAFILVVLFYWTCAFDPVKHAERLIKRKIIPLIKYNPKIKLNTTNLRICRCSIESGCNSLTVGWLPSILEEVITEHDRWWYHEICVTDGDCYQITRTKKYEPSYGCIDVDYRITHFHPAWDRPNEGCVNRTVYGVPEWWICCREKSYCANSTILVPPTPEISTTTVPAKPVFSEEGILAPWKILLFLSGVFLLAGVIIGFALFRQETRWCFYKILGRNFPVEVVNRNQQAQNNNNTRRLPNVEDSNDVEHVLMEMYNLRTVEQSASCTQSSTLEDSDSPRDLPPSVASLFKQLESTNGSGAGAVLLQERTIAHQINILRRIGSGRFGSVYLGTWKGEQVAVKIFKSSDEMAYLREVNIYETRMLRHPNVLRFVASDRLDRGTLSELWLVTEYHPLGSLREYITRNTVNFETALKFIRSSANGIAFLHSEVLGSSKSSKPGIAHRDIKSRNIMVKNDMECAIGDLGLSVINDPLTGTIDLSSMGRCGTARYIAPEILSNTMQQNVFESYQMADMYAFAMVMWEILMRCEEDGIVFAEDAENSVPYAELTEREPDVEEMYQIVCVQNQRPVILPKWNENEKFAFVVDLMKGCWTRNPSARYSAVQVRIKIGRMMAKSAPEIVNTETDCLINEDTYSSATFD